MLSGISILIGSAKRKWKPLNRRCYSLGRFAALNLTDRLARLNTERSYKRQGHAPLKHFVGFLCNGGKQNNGRTT